jgi:hypothetical protein
MEEVNESWVQVMTTNENGPKELISKEIFLNVQSSEIVVVVRLH